MYPPVLVCRSALKIKQARINDTMQISKNMAAQNEQQIWLLNCLNATLDPNQEVRKAAEVALNEASVHQGYGVALAKVTVNRDLSIGLRQLAAVLLKRYVKQHWLEGEKDYVPPTVPLEDKASIRSILPVALGDPHGKIQTAVGMAVATIATWDWPEEWPDLMRYILGCINDRADINKVHGALRCLALFAGEVDDRQVPHLVPLLFPSLYAIVSSPSTYESSMRRQALIILHSCIATMGIMSGAYQSETRELMSPMLKAWMEQFASILASPVRSEDPEDWGLRTEVLKSLQQIVQNFSKLAFSEFPVVLGPLWQTFVSGLQVYQVAAVEGAQEAYTGLGDSDGGDQSLEAFAIQLFEFLLSLAGSPRYSKVVRKNISELAYYTIGYMQMTEEQVQTWSGDPNQYVADEDDLAYSCRVSGVMLLDELVEAYEKDGVDCIVEAVSKRIKEADQARANGHTGWWKLREAAILALGSSVDFKIHKEPPGFSVDILMNNILVEDLSTGFKECPFLYGRALWAAAKFSSAINKEKGERFLFAAMEGLSQDAEAPIMIGSCRALSELLPKMDVSMYQPHLGAIFAALGTQLQEVSEETLHLVLETLQTAIRADKQPSAAVEAMMSPLLLNIWAKYVSDPFIAVDALEALEAIKNIPGCLEPLAARVLPFLARILAHPQNQQPGLVAGALDLLTMLLKNASMEVLRNAYSATFASVITILMHTDDHTELQNATECLTAFVQYGGVSLLDWASDVNLVMKMLLDAAARLLNPNMDSSGALFVGTFTLQLIQQLSSHMAPYLRGLVTALVIRMESVNLKMSLILVFPRLVHLSAPNFGQFIDLLVSVPSAKYGNALSCVMSEWTKYHDEIQGAYQIKVSTTALAHLLACGHPQLSQIFVQGRLVQSQATGIMTRSRSKVQPDQWTTVSLPEKIFSLLAGALVEMQEETANGIDEDDAWEEISNDNEDGDDEPTTFMDKLTKAVFQPLEGFEHLLTEAIEEDDDSPEDPSAATDPINQINLQAYLVEFMKKFSQEAGHAFSDLFKGLSDQEKAAVQAAIRS